MKKESRNTDQLRKLLFDAYGRVVKRAAASRQRDEGVVGESAGRTGHRRKIKMAALARRVADIFTLVAGFWSHVPAELEKTDFLTPYVQRIVASSERAALLTRRLIAFSRNELVGPAPVVVPEVIRRRVGGHR